MNLESCPAEQHTPANHCWHPTGRVLTRLPEYDVFVCCNCGHEHHVQRVTSASLTVPALHGPYAPDHGVITFLPHSVTP